MRHALPILLLVVLTGCTTAKMGRQHEADWIVVAGIDGGTSRVQDLVRLVLKEKGIDCGMEGSLGYDVLVPGDRVAEARQLLQGDPRLRAERIWFPSPKAPAK